MTPSVPLRPDEQAPQIVARDILAYGSAKRREVGGSEHRLDSGNSVSRDPVLEGLRSACVRGDVAADLRLLACTGIGREEEPGLPDDAPQLRSADPCVDLDAPLERIERTYSSEVLETEHDAAAEPNAASGITRSAAAWHDRNVVAVTPRHYLGDILGRPRERNRVDAPY